MKSNTSKAKGKGKRNKALSPIKFSYIAQMASVEKEMVYEYIQNEEKRRNYNASLKEKRQTQNFPQDSKTFPKEKEKYDNMMTKNKSLKIIIRF